MDFKRKSGRQKEKDNTSKEKDDCMQGLITIRNLDKGLSNWHSHKNWEKDLHSDLYIKLREKKDTLVIQEYWLFLVEMLIDWTAVRPLSREEITSRGNKVLPEIEKNIQYVQRKYKDHDSILNVEYNYLEHLFNLAKSIKGVDRPVFASKMCHFIFPDLYPVIDNVFVGLGNGYYEYWRECQSGWLVCQNKEEIIAEFIIKGCIEPYDMYPYHTKIAELCKAGSRSGG
jgi:hypothetical protein